MRGRPNRVTVLKSQRGKSVERDARGLSSRGVREENAARELAKHFSSFIDPRRKTLHEQNAKSLTSLLGEKSLGRALGK